MKLPHAVLCLTLLMLLPARALAEPSPPPGFESGYVLPAPTQPPPRVSALEYMDLAVLVGALVFSAVLAHRWRSRKGLLLLAIASLAYFGFYRQGCVCAIGAIQNIAMGLAQPAYAVPLPVIGFFVLPLAMALFCGRVFCGAVCPLGAIQEIVVLRPLRVPAWLERSLRLLAYVYLAATVLFATTEAAFVICQYDPFVAFFRLSGALTMLVLGAAMLVLGVFVARPYCRFLCPLGVLLSHVSRVSAWRVKITPRECIRCRLCEDACPYGAIRLPTDASGPVPARTSGGRGMMAMVILLTPLLAALGAVLGAGLSTLTSQAHPTVRLAGRVYQEQTQQVTGTTNESDAFRKTRRPAKELYAQASTIHRRFVIGGYAAGGFVGLAVGLGLVAAGCRTRRSEYQADKASCLACGRCFDACPVDRAVKEGKTLKIEQSGADASEK